VHPHRLLRALMRARPVALSPAVRLARSALAGSALAGSALAGALAAGALSGCGGAAGCPDGSVAEGDRCVAPDAGPGADGGPEDGGPGADGGPCGVCEGTSPVCDAASGACVECTAEDEGACEAGESCFSNACAQCGDDDDCTDASAARCEGGQCVGCDDDAQCASVAGGLGVCASGRCVQCTAMDRSACGPNVCDATTNRCTTRPQSSADLCQDCVADAECQPGQLCVPMDFDATAVGRFCLWRQDAAMPPGPGGSCTNVRPYVDAVAAESVDGATATVCSLALTTCPALQQFRMQSCTTPVVSDDECGVAGLDDGLCRMASALTNLCTVPCGSDNDCRLGFTCTPTGFCEL